MTLNVRVGDKDIGEGRKVFIIGEIGINHNGSLDNAKRLIDIAKVAECDAVKFQKRVPEEAVPEEYKNVKRETPWGIMTYFEYRKRIEFSKKDYEEIDRYCRENEILWSASPWDLPSIDFLIELEVPFIKVPSALITHKQYLEKIKSVKDEKGIPVVVSTGMADMALVERLVDFLGEENMVLMHAVSAYPAKNDEINLRALHSFKKRFQCPIGYSGHELGLQVSLAAVAMGAMAVERHITLSRAMWGTDQGASLEPEGLFRLVRDIRIIEQALGSGEKKMVPGEKSVVEKLRKISDF